MQDAESLSVQELNNAGVALCAEGDFEQGLALLRRAQSLAPGDSDINCSLGYALSQHGQTSESLIYLKKAIEIDPHHIAAIDLLQTLAPGLLIKRSHEGSNHERIKPVLEATVPSEPPSVGAIRRPRRRKRSALLSALSVAILVAGGLWAYNKYGRHHVTERPLSSYAYRIASVIDDTAENRATLVHSGWKQPTAVMSPEDMRSIKHYFQINAKNDLATFVGVATIDGKLQAFIQKSGTFTSLGVLPGETESCALSVDDSDDVVGYSGTLAHRAVLWQNGKTYDLNTLAPSPAGQVLLEGLNIDNNGEIVVSAIDRHGYMRLLKLDPQRPQSPS